MTRRAWYIGCRADEVGEAAILVGDPGRIARIAEHLTAPHFVDENRGLRTVTGERLGRRITVTAFGMGAPIAAIVLHELFDLGVRAFLRIGTAMVMPPASLGDFVLADAAFRAEGTSATYAPSGYPAVADFMLNACLRARLARTDRRWHAGIFGTYDGFYSQMFVLSEGERAPVDRLREEATRLRLLATDMETSALLTVGRLLGARAASLCLGTVDGMTQAKLAAEPLADGERELFEIALDALVVATDEEIQPR